MTDLYREKAERQVREAEELLASMRQTNKDMARLNRVSKIVSWCVLVLVSFTLVVNILLLVHKLLTR